MRYDAFISYRHSELDMYIAKKVHSGLENYKLPPSVRKLTGRKKINRVFRDQEELPIGSDLGDNITKALEESEYLIVICSPRTRESYWVLQEIETFVSIHDRQHVLAILVEGEPNESFPEILLVDDYGNAVEPLAADVRGQNKKEINKKLKSELTRLAAALIGCNYDDLRQRRRERRIKHIAGLVSAAAIIVATLAGGFAVYNAKMAAEIEQNYNLAVENYDLAMENYRKAQVNESRYISETASNLFESGNRQTAALLALEALGSDDEDNARPYSPHAEYALSRVLYSYDIGANIEMDSLLTHKLPVKDMKYSYGGKYFLSEDQGGTVYAWDPISNRMIVTVPFYLDDRGDVLKPIEFAGDDDSIYIANYQGIIAYDYNGSAKWRYGAEAILSCSTDVENGLAFLESLDKLFVVDLKNGNKIGEIDSEEGYVFSDYITYCKGNNSFAVGVHTSGLSADRQSFIHVYDIDTLEEKKIAVPFSHVAELNCFEDGHIVVTGYNYNDAYDSTIREFDSYIVCYEPDSLKQLYNKSIRTTAGDFANTRYILKLRDIDNEEKNGEKYPEIIFSVGKNVYVFDMYTGDEISQVNLATYVRNVLVSLVSEDYYVAQENGNINVVNGLTGKINPSEAISCDINLMDFSLSNQVMMIRKYGGTDILVYKFHEGQGITEVYTQDEGYIYGMSTSPDGETVALNVSTEDDFIIQLVDTKGNKLGVINDEAVNAVYYENEQFIADGRYLVTNSEQQMCIFEPKTMKMTAVDGLEDVSFYIKNVYVTRNGRYALMYSRMGVAVIDLVANKLASAFEFEGNTGGCSVISEDGKYVYTVSVDNAFTILDVTTGEITRSDIGELRISNEMQTMTNIAASPDGRYIAVCCADYKVRIYNTVNKSIEYEFDMCGDSRQYMYFMNDSSKFLFQGDDYYLHIADMSSGRMVFSSEGQWNIVSEAFEDAERGVIVLCNSNGVMVLETETFVPVAFADNSGSYNMKSKELYQHSRYQLYSFKYQTLNSLREEAWRQFPDMELTDEIRLKYNL